MLDWRCLFFLWCLNDLLLVLIERVLPRPSLSRQLQRVFVKVVMLSVWMMVNCTLCVNVRPLGVLATSIRLVRPSSGVQLALRSLSFGRLLSFLLLFLLLLPLEPLLFDLKHLYLASQNDIELVSIVALVEDELLGRVELVTQLAADLSQVLHLNLAALEERVLLDEWHNHVQVLLESVLWILLQTVQHVLTASNDNGSLHERRRRRSEQVEA